MNKRPAMQFLSNNSEWKEVTLGELCEIITVGIANSATHAYVDDGIIMLRNQNIKENRLDDSDVICIDEEFEKRYVNKRLKENDLIVARTGYPGTACVVPRKYEGAQTFTTLIARLKNGIDPYYTCQYINSGYGKKYFISTQIGGGQKNSGAGILKDFPLIFPSSIAEQKKIAHYFARIDALLVLHQNKYDKLLTYKKAMLEKMFPKDGTDVPEVRFAGFVDSWTRRSFSEITFLSGQKNKDNLPLESYSITNENGFVPQNEKFENGGTMKDADKRMYYIVTPHSFAYNPARINIGSIGYYDLSKDVIVSSLYEVFKTTDEVDDRFLWHWFKSDDFQRLIYQLQEGGVRLYFYYDKLCMGQLALPRVEEQKKIGAYFDQLDNLIVIQRKKLERLKVMKKALLEKMFV